MPEEEKSTQLAAKLLLRGPPSVGGITRCVEAIREMEAQDLDVPIGSQGIARFASDDRLTLDITIGPGK